MASAPQAPPVTPEPIFAAANAYQLSFALRGALELGLFSAIAAGNTDAASLAASCNASERGCRILSDFLTVHGFLAKADGKWSLTPVSAAFLDKKSPAYVGSVFEFLHTPEMVEPYFDVARLVRKGGTSKGSGTVEPDNPVWVKFAHGMAPLLAPAAEDIAAILGTIDGRVLDIAAGHGLFGIEIAKKSPVAQIVALDWAAVLEVAKENAGSAGVDSRYSTIAGSAFDQDFGSGYDLVLLTNILHHFDQPTCVSLIRKVRAALKDGGRALTLEFVPDESRVTPPQAAVFALTMLGSTPSGDAYTFSELDAMFREAGFTSTEMRDLPRSPERILISTK